MKATISICVTALLGLAACQPAVPNSAPDQGVGFGDYSEYETARLRREAELSGRPLTPTTASGSAIVPPSTNPAVITSSELAAAGIGGRTGQSAAAINTSGRVAGFDASPANVRVDLNNPDISDEQSFDAVADRETIESDAARRQAQAQQYQVIQPTALPTRDGATGPNIVAYALATTNDPGTPITRRVNFNAQSKYERNCSAYASADQAQVDFLARGGPETDRLGLDPDGDGFACGWDPRPFRAAVRN